jgi:hypothetical protein
MTSMSSVETLLMRATCGGGSAARGAIFMIILRLARVHFRSASYEVVHEDIMWFRLPHALH